MENLNLVILDAQNNQTIERLLTEDEVLEYQDLQKASSANETLINSNRASALAKLAALGLTEEEIAAL
jgi:hypothetical protein